MTSQQFFAGFDYESMLQARPNLLDPKYLQPNQFQAPREVRLLVRWEF